MAEQPLELADIFNRHGEAYREAHGGALSTAQRRVMSAIELCRTAGLLSSQLIPTNSRAKSRSRAAR
jgi:hypothetical protein